MTEAYSKDELIRFTNFVSDKDLVKYQTARGWRTAVSKLLNDLSEEEESDVRKVDVEIAVHRTANRTSGTISPGSLKTYKSRVLTAIEEFLKWREDPANYKPRGLNKQSRSKQKPKAANSSALKEQPSINSGNENKDQKSGPKETIHHSHGLSLSYPLRSDFLAQVVIPRDMSELEAKRLGAFILTLATDYQPE